jgi:hypothetical protein
MRLLAILLVPVLVAVLATRDGDAPAAATTSGTHTLVSFHRTGGFAGREDHVVVRTDRRFTVRSKREAVRRGRLSRAGMRKLRRDLDRARIDHPPAAPPPGCGDCFIYEIAYKGHRVKVTDGAIPERMRPAITRLTRLAG